MKETFQKVDLKKILAVGGLTAVIGLTGAGFASADYSGGTSHGTQGNHSNDSGYQRDNQHQDGRGSDCGNSNWRQNNNRGNCHQVTISGRVVSSDNHSLIVRANGTTYRVENSGCAGRDLHCGDWVRVRGTVRGNTIYAESIR